MVLPFAIGAGLSHALYKEFIDPKIQFAHFMLFTGVAYSITAFPVLCRILTELKLLDTTVGIVVLSAGVGNDIGMRGHLISPPIVTHEITSWMDTACTQRCACKRWFRRDGSLHSSCLYWMDYIPFASR
jgi:Kef-type K+ transport system membrane component KefB